VTPQQRKVKPNAAESLRQQHSTIHLPPFEEKGTRWSGQAEGEMGKLFHMTSRDIAVVTTLYNLKQEGDVVQLVLFKAEKRLA
jgi:hypothetical protein